MIDSIVPIILIFLYITFMVLLNHYKSMNLKKKNINKELLKDNPVYLLYIYGNNKPNKLFFLTILSLINKNYYSLERKGETLCLRYLKKDLLKYEDENLTESEKKVIGYVNSLLYKEDKNMYISLDKLDNTIVGDFSFTSILNNFMVALRKEVKEKYGLIDKYADVMPIILLCFLYSLQIIIFFKLKLNILVVVLLALLFTIVTMGVINLFKNKIVNHSFKRYLIIYIVSVILALTSYFIWSNNYMVDYIIYHVILGLFAFMYPLLIFTAIYFIHTNNFYRNSNQRDIVNLLNEVKKELEDTNKVTEEDYIYVLGLNIKKKILEEDYYCFKKKFNL